LVQGGASPERIETARAPRKRPIRVTRVTQAPRRRPVPRARSISAEIMLHRGIVSIVLTALS